MVDTGAMSDSERAAQQYDEMVVSYATEKERNIFSSLFERPSTITRLGDVSGRAVLEDGLDFQPDRSVDLVVASLVLHYVRNWHAVFSEFRRVLVPGGGVVFSTRHPAMDWQLHSVEDYFAVKQVTETWTMLGEPFDVTFWCRPLTAMTAAVSSAGFVLEQLVEPVPGPEIQQRDPEVARQLRTEPSFIFFRVRASLRAEPGGRM